MRPGSFSNENVGRSRQNRPAQNQPAPLNPLNNSARNILNTSRDSSDGTKASLFDPIAKSSQNNSVTKTTMNEPENKMIQEPILPSAPIVPLKQVKREPDPLLSSLFTTMMYPDVAFVVDGRRFSAHRGIIATGCEYFRNIFMAAGEDDESKDTDIEIPGISAETFKTFLEYIYKKEVNLTEELALELLQVSSDYAVPELNKIAGDYLIVKLTVENFVRVTKAVDKYGGKETRTQVLKFMSLNLVPLREKEDLRDLPVSILIEVLDLLQPKEV